jgi:hypothetical protein
MMLHIISAGSSRNELSAVMPALVAGIHAFVPDEESKTWMPGTRLHKAGHDEGERSVSSLTRRACASPRHDLPELCQTSPSKIQRAQGMPGVQAAPAALCAKDESTQA